MLLFEPCFGMLLGEIRLSKTPNNRHQSLLIRCVLFVFKFSSRDKQQVYQLQLILLGTQMNILVQKHVNKAKCKGNFLLGLQKGKCTQRNWNTLTMRFKLALSHFLISKITEPPGVSSNSPQDRKTQEHKEKNNKIRKADWLE